MPRTHPLRPSPRADPEIFRESESSGDEFRRAADTVENEGHVYPALVSEGRVAALNIADVSDSSHFYFPNAGPPGNAVNRAIHVPRPYGKPFLVERCTERPHALIDLPNTHIFGRNKYSISVSASKKVAPSDPAAQ